MRRSNSSTERRWADDRGSASLEFITAGLILLVPLVYLVLTMAAIQAGALAAEGAVRQAARVFVQGETVADAQARASRAIEFALADYGINPTQATVTVACTPRPSECLTRQGFVTVSISLAVPLPLLPPVLTSDVPPAVQLQASATQQVSRFAGVR